jgi:hypothetical protein
MTPLDRGQMLSENSTCSRVEEHGDEFDAAWAPKRSMSC